MQYTVIDKTKENNYFVVINKYNKNDWMTVKNFLFLQEHYIPATPFEASKIVSEHGLNKNYLDFPTKHIYIKKRGFKLVTENIITNNEIAIVYDKNGEYLQTSFL